MKQLLTSPVWFLISGSLIVASIVFFALGGLKLGVDFTGGSILQVRFTGLRPTVSEIQEAVTPVLPQAPVVQPAGIQSMVLRSTEMDPETQGAVIQALTDKFGEVTEESFSSIGPTIGEELKQKAVVAILIVLIAIILYISWAFRAVSIGPVPSWTYGVAAIVALIHDILLTAGAFAVLGYFYNIQIDSLFVTALLTILGFSVHDTIVVFDRIRERLRRVKDEPFKETIRESIRSTAARSLNTSITALLMLLALLLFGGEAIRWFLFALVVGVIVGSYSSIFIASQLLLVFRDALRKTEAEAEKIS